MTKYSLIFVIFFLVSCEQKRKNFSTKKNSANISSSEVTTKKNLPNVSSNKVATKTPKVILFSDYYVGMSLEELRSKRTKYRVGMSLEEVRSKKIKYHFAKKKWFHKL